MVFSGECCVDYLLRPVFTLPVQSDVSCMWTNDSKRILLEHFDAIQDSPSYLYHYALPFCPSSSWLCECYIAELSQEVRVVGLQEEWGMCFRTVLLDSVPSTLSYSNNTIAVGSAHEDILILDAITGSQTGVLHGHAAGVTSIAFSSDGTSLVSGSDDKTAKLWDMQTGGVVKTFSHKYIVSSVSISADNTTIASGSEDEMVYLWNIQTGACYKTIQQFSQVQYVTFSPKDPQTFISVAGRAIWHCNIDDNGYKDLDYYGCYHAFSPDGTQLLTGRDGCIKVQNTNSGEVVASHNVYGDAFCLSPDGRLIAIESDKEANIWNITGSSPHLIGSLVGHTLDIASLVFSSNCTLVSISFDKSVKFWRLDTSSTDLVVTDSESIPLIPTPTRPAALKQKSGPIIPRDLPDWPWRTWGVSTGQCKGSLRVPAEDSHQRNIQPNDNKLIFVWYIDSRINIWDAEKGELLQTINIPNGTIKDMRVSADGLKLYCRCQKSIQAWDIRTGEIVGEVEFEQSVSGISVIDGSTVWIDIYDEVPDEPYHTQTQGWDFGIPGSSPVQVSSELPNELHLNDTKLWETSMARVKDNITGKVVFQLSKRFGKPVHVQWGGQYLVINFPLWEVLILDFSNVSL